MPDIFNNIRYAAYTKLKLYGISFSEKLGPVCSQDRMLISISKISVVTLFGQIFFNCNETSFLYDLNFFGIRVWLIVSIIIH